MSDQRFELHAIGRVTSDAGTTRLAIDEPYREALAGLDGFSHVHVLCWFHLFDEPEYRAITTSERPYRDAPDRLGIFATRSPIRPNPLALSVVPVLAIDAAGGLLEVPYIDAEPGTPILDIKPYHPAVDRVRDATVPEWCAGWPQWYEDSMTFDWSSVFENAR